MINWEENIFWVVSPIVTAWQMKIDSSFRLVCFIPHLILPKGFSLQSHKLSTPLAFHKQTCAKKDSHEVLVSHDKVFFLFFFNTDRSEMTREYCMVCLVAQNFQIPLLQI